MLNETYVKNRCPVCGAPREIVKFEIYGYKGQLAIHELECPSCNIGTFYKSELSLGGDYIKYREVTDYRVQSMDYIPF